MSHERLSFVQGDIRDASARARRRRARRRDRQRRRRVARREVDRDGGSEFVRTNVEGTQILLDAIREAPVERFILISSSEVYGTAELGADGRRASAQPAQPVRRDEGGRGPARVLVLRHVRAADRDRAAVQQLRPAAASGEGHPALHHAGAAGRAADDPRRRARVARLAVRRRRRGGDRGGDRGADRRASPAR